MRLRLALLSGLLAAACNGSTPPEPQSAPAAATVTTPAPELTARLTAGRLAVGSGFVCLARDAEIACVYTDSEDAAVRRHRPGEERAVEIRAGHSGVCARLEGGGLRCWNGNEPEASAEMLAQKIDLLAPAALAIDRQVCVADGGDRRVQCKSFGAIHSRGGWRRVEALDGSRSLVVDRVAGLVCGGTDRVSCTSLETGAPAPAPVGRGQPFGSSGSICALVSERIIRCSHRIAEGGDRVEAPGAISSADAAAGAACAVVDGDVHCWGHNSYARVEATETVEITRSRIALPGPAVEVAVGEISACALLGDGGVWCWGGYRAGEPRRLL